MIYSPKHIKEASQIFILASLPFISINNRDKDICRGLIILHYLEYFLVLSLDVFYAFSKLFMGGILVGFAVRFYGLFIIKQALYILSRIT